MPNPNRILLASACLLISCLCLSCGQRATNVVPARSGGHAYVVVPPGTHPGLLFSKKELPALRERTKATGLPGEAWQRVENLARADSSVNFEGAWDAHRLRAMALVYQVSGDKKAAREAIDYFMRVLRETEPFAYYKKVDSDFFETENWPIAFACAWDWLHEAMSEAERKEALPLLELWCKALYEHTESWWWRDASYNCGAIPVGALGLLCTAIRGETAHPEFNTWFESCIGRIRDNFFPTSWRASGICYEGPCYAQYTRNAILFGEALRRTGGEDIVRNSGAINAMHYQVFQWLPQEGCAPVGDNTGYGRRVFVGSYLLGVEEMQDSAALWTFEKYTDRRRLDPLLTFLWYPSGLNPVSPKQAGWPTSYYFEIAPNRAGYVYSRSEWDNERAHFFAFVTRYSGANHQHYDHNTFLFNAFGDEFGTHRNIYGYSDPDHGADKEHNIVIVDGGGWPANDRSGSAGDDCSTGGLMVGLGLGHFADYARGDAKESYRDNSVRGSCPALRADRAVLFVKQGPVPYLLVTDDIQQSSGRHDYDWLWFSLDSTVTGSGACADPVLLKGQNATCAISFLEPARPKLSFGRAGSGEGRRRVEMGQIKVRQSGSRVRYVALAAAWENGAAQPSVRPGPAVQGNPKAVSVIVEGPGFSDLLVWQPEDSVDGPAQSVTCGEMTLQGYLGLVRLENNAVSGYVLAEGGHLAWAGKDLAKSGRTVSVSADLTEARVTGKMESRQGDSPEPGEATIWTPGPGTGLYLDGKPVAAARTEDGMTKVGSSGVQ